MSPRSDVDTSTPATSDTHTPTTESEHLIDYSAGQVGLVRGACQEVAHTKSRRTGPRRWLRAARWLIAAGLHGRANATTLKVAEDLAARMDYTTGHVRYGLEEMAARLGISRASVARHVGYLRELGALAWVQHGSRINIRRALGLSGYAATATVYAAVIPPVYDHAMGHTVIGAGYEARIVIDQRGQNHNADPQNPTTVPAVPVDNSPVDNVAAKALETPSLTWDEEERKQKVESGEENYTSRERASRDRTSIPHPAKGSSGRHALQVAEDIRITRLVRALVNWTQREGLRRLAYSLRPLIDRGLDSYAIAEYLHGLCTGMRWQPKAPAAYIRTVLDSQAQADRTRQEAVARYELENPVPGAFQASVPVQRSVMAALEEGIARYQQTIRARGHEDLCTPHLVDIPEHTEADAAADFAAFLGTNTVLTPAF